MEQNKTIIDNPSNILELRNLKIHFPLTEGTIFGKNKGSIKAVDGIDLQIQRGETLGLVGESGCGKTTLGRAAIMLYKPTEGQIIFEGTDLTKFNKSRDHSFRQKMQMIFQDPFASLNPRMTVGNIIAEPIFIQKTTDATILV